MEPRIQYATASDGVSIAFWAMGNGTPIVQTPLLFSHIQMEWQLPTWRPFFERLSQKRTLVRYDRRGSGLSQRDVTDYSLNALVRDVEAVADRLQLTTLALHGLFFSAPVAIAYAARHPERVSRLILYCPLARASDLVFPGAEALAALRDANWELYTETLAHVALGWSAGQPARRTAALFRESITPQGLRALGDASAGWDVTPLLPQVKCPALIIWRRQIATLPVEWAREFVTRMPDSRLVLLEGEELTFFAGDLAQAIDEFLGEGEQTSAPVEPSPAAGLVTILFTDIEGSTALTQRLGDVGARAVLREHERITRECLRAHGGAEVKTMGDGFMASFGSATKALECAIAIQRAFEARNASLPAHPEALEGRAEPQPSAHPFDSAQDRASTGSARADRGVSASSAGEAIRVRIGLNAGEPIAEDEDLFGTAVIRAARIAALAQGGEILAANVVRELAEGKGFLFGDRGEAALRGFDDPVRLFEVRWRPPSTELRTSFDSLADAGGSG